MTIYLTAPSHGPGGPDGQGWNRLSLNAHMVQRDQCGLGPLNYWTLFESMTGRQRWGGFDRCSSGGRCGSCPVQRRHLDGQEGLTWPERTALLLARIRPFPPSPGAHFADPAAGRSSLQLSSWRGDGAAVGATWQQVRDTPGLRLGRSFGDADGEAFWLVRNNPRASAELVRSAGRKGATRRKTYARHELYAGPGREEPLALLMCHGGCAHATDDLQHLAADLADHDATRAPGALAVMPARLPGAPGIEISHDGSRSVIRRCGTITRIDWRVPFDDFTASALAAYAVRLSAIT